MKIPGEKHPDTVRVKVDGARLFWPALAVALGVAGWWVPSPVVGGLAAAAAVVGWWRFRRAEEAWERTRRDLVENHLRVQQEVLRARQKAVEAEQQGAAKSELLANLSHEIRTSLNGVIGLVELLLDTEMDPGQRRYVESMQTSGLNLLNLLNDILDFSKMEAGRLKLETREFDLPELLDEFSATTAIRAHQKGLELICAPEPNLPSRWRGDPARLRQILTNLVGNALKFTPAGEIAVSVTRESLPDGRPLLRFGVRDTGIGIPASVQPALFQRFTQASSATSRQFGGTGLGLTICRQLVHLMGGEIGFTSREDAGSEFWFTVPLEPSVGPVANPVAPSLGGWRVLVVEPNSTQGQALVAHLAAWGAECRLTREPEAAAAECRRAADAGRPYGLVVADAHLPPSSTQDLVGAVRQQSSAADPPILWWARLGTLARPGAPVARSGLGRLHKPILWGETRELFHRLTRAGVPAGEAPTEPVRALRAPSHPHPSGARLLIAEDLPINRMVVIGLFRKLGYEVEVVEHGGELLRALEQRDYDVVFLDLMMPEVDGWEVVRRVRDPRSPVRQHQVPLIAMTAHALAGDRERCLRAGFSGYLTKPVLLPEVVAVLRQWLPPEVAPSADFAAEQARERSDRHCLNIPLLWERFLHDRGHYLTVLQLARDDLPRQFAQIRQRHAARDLVGLRREAHNLKGVAATLCATEVQEGAQAVEQVCQSGDEAARAAVLDRLEGQVARLVDALEEALRQPPA